MYLYSCIISLIFGYCVLCQEFKMRLMRFNASITMPSCDISNWIVMASTHSTLALIEQSHVIPIGSEGEHEQREYVEK